MGQAALSVAQLLPVPDAEELMIRPRSSSGTQAASRASGERKAAAAQRLITHHAIADGTALTIVVPDLVDQDRDANGDAEQLWEKMYLIRDHVRSELQPDGPTTGLIGRRRLSFYRHRRAGR